MVADSGIAAATTATTTLATAIMDGGLTTTMPSVALRPQKELAGFTSFAAEGSPWIFRDARGTGRPWALTVSATNFTRLANLDNDSFAVTSIPRNALQISLSEVLPEAGADIAPDSEVVTLSDQQQTLISAREPAKGSYSVRPTFTMRVISEIAALVGDSFACTITYTIG
ncbi:MAG: hypothetical protein H7248_05770 [Microbacteriaceae bacterium]|nr:hypothetical protein [Microbacteriaceae bacterium]